MPSRVLGVLGLKAQHTSKFNAGGADMWDTRAQGAGVSLAHAQILQAFGGVNH